MNKFELDKTMECLGIEKKDYYEINECKYYHGGTYYTVVEGKTPYELAKIINKKYDNTKYLIRVNGNNELEIPQRDIYTYHIDTIEGLVVFLLETKAYYFKEQLNDEKINAFLNSVYTKILEHVNPRMNIYDWMLDRENRKDYFKPLLSINSSLDIKIRKKIEIFDNIVNPFCNNDLAFNNIGFSVRGYGYQENNWFSLIDKETAITMTTIREKDGFVMKLHIPTNLPYGYTVYHYFNQNGEEIAFAKYDETGLSRIEYNLINFSFGEHYGIKRQVTTEDKNFVLQHLDEYIALASNIVKKNLELNSTNKKILKIN